MNSDIPAIKKKNNISYIYGMRNFVHSKGFPGRFSFFRGIGMGALGDKMLYGFC